VSNEEEIECPECGKALKMADVEQGECPHCHAVFEVEVEEEDIPEVKTTPSEENEETDDVDDIDEELKELEEKQKERQDKENKKLQDKANKVAHEYKVKKVSEDNKNKPKKDKPDIRGFVEEALKDFKQSDFLIKEGQTFTSVFKGGTKILAFFSKGRNLKVEFFNIKKLDFEHEDLKVSTYKEKYTFHRLVTKDVSLYYKILESIEWD